ncbi:DUF2892 domain-containing protein [Halostella sp. JP-L12]|uniref:YgaP family membrane protein n=1 Tax=Halostella TaxID=1843185 RepID=UPI000EF76006|nr:MULTISPECIES: DUF2892 domain-containing protein [Halostella]NHN47437.1 DUF2892 domain-containing protein [Halostella sp. JP-L12]
MLERNVGGTDRLARLGFGSVLVFIGTVVALAVEWPLVGALTGLFGGGLVASALARRCLVNEIVGVDTSEK